MIINSRLFNRSELVGFISLLVLLIVVLPLVLDIFRLNLVAKYLTYAFVAIGLVLCWGYGGILSLGQGVFFGLGGYCMAMFLKLEASSVANTKIQSTPGIPDFMDWNQLTALPFLWKPFHSFPFTLLAIVLVPGIFAFIIGASFGLLFQRDVRGYGSSLGWGLGYGIFWWFLGPMTIMPLWQGRRLDWSYQHGQELYGSLVGHIVYGLIVGVIYAAVDRLWCTLFIESDPINHQTGSPRLPLVAVHWLGSPGRTDRWTGILTDYCCCYRPHQYSGARR